MLEDLSYDRGVGNRGQDPAPAVASGADQNVSQEHPSNQLGPRVIATLATPLGWLWFRVARAGLRFVATARVERFGSGDDRRANACGGGEDTVIGNQRAPRPGDQGTESFEKRGGREHDRAGPVLPLALELVDHHPIAVELEPVVADRASRDVAHEPFEAIGTQLRDPDVYSTSVEGRGHGARTRGIGCSVDP